MTATGKSSIGKLVAKHLNYEFVDSDSVIEQRAGADISWIFEIEGERKFRARETAVLRDLTSLYNIVLATGGGAVLRTENRSLLRSHGWVACLSTPLDVLVHRVQKSTTRPLLENVDPRVRLQEMHDERFPLYKGIADKTFDTFGLSKQETASQIIEWFTNKTE